MAGLLRRIANTFYKFFTYFGDSLVKFPNKVFYTVLMITSILFHIFAIFLIVCLLFSIYREKRKSFETGGFRPWQQ